MIHIVDKISSTNDWLSKYYLDIDDTVIALEQTSGKGRRGNVWDSKRGGFYMSTISSNHKLLPTVVAVSLMRVLSENIADFSEIGIFRRSRMMAFRGNFVISSASHYRKCNGYGRLILALS